MYNYEASTRQSHLDIARTSARHRMHVIRGAGDIITNTLSD